MKLVYMLGEPAIQLESGELVHPATIESAIQDALIYPGNLLKRRRVEAACVLIREMREDLIEMQKALKMIAHSPHLPDREHPGVRKAQDTLDKLRRR